VERLTYYDCAGAACFDYESPVMNGVMANKAISRLAKYEDTGLTPEDCAAYAKAENEKRIVLFENYDELNKVRALLQAEREGRLVVLDKKPLPLVSKPDCTDAYCPYCDEDVSGLWGVADYVPDICQCPECGEFVDVCAPTITREEVKAKLKEVTHETD
jgi:hypothetical protein